MKEILTFIINPFFIVTLLFLGGLLSSRLKNKIKLFFYSSLVFIVCSAPITSIIFSYPLIKSVQVVNKDNEKKIRSVIVLGAGIKKNILGQWIPSVESEDRTLLGKFYSEKLSIPLLISGGLTASDRISEAFVIKNHLNLKNIIIEQNSRNTFESARNLSKYCEKEIGPFLLITGDAHILRSYLTFKSHKCEVLIVNKSLNFNVSDLFPSSYGIKLFENVIYEYLGIFYYLVTNKIKILVLFDI